MSADRKPTRKQIETTLDVLLWLSSTDRPEARAKDDIGYIRYLLEDVLDPEVSK